MQLDIFDCLYDKYKITKPIRLIELFAGIGSQAKALKNIGANFEHHRICEWAIPSILAYASIHRDELPNYGIDYSKGYLKEEIANMLYGYGVSSDYNKPATLEQLKRMSEDKLKLIYNSIMWENNLVDISRTSASSLKIDEKENYTYIMTYSFPCQDLSLAGKCKGMSRDSGTRSGLLWEVERILKEGARPDVLLMENVPQVVGEKNKDDFQSWMSSLESMGYKNYWQILNAKDYGIPKNRQRCFMVSCYGEYDYKFPEVKLLDIRMENVVEKDVEESFYLDDEHIERIKKWKSQQNPMEQVMGRKSICPTITTIIAESLDGGVSASARFYCEQLEQTTNLKISSNEQIKCQQLYDLNYYNHEQSNRVYGVGELCPTICTGYDEAKAIKIAIFNQKKLRVRKLTPKECYRLMGFSDLDYEMAKSKINQGMLYHTSGDSICVNVLEAIFKEMI